MPPCHSEGARKMARAVSGLCWSGSRISGASARLARAAGRRADSDRPQALSEQLHRGRCRRMAYGRSGNRISDISAGARFRLKAVAIHKAIPLGPVPMDHYRMDDIDAAAAAFPDLQFEVVHGGFAFIEETAFQLARFSNVWVNLETTANLAVAKPAVFERVMAGLIGQAGEGALDRIVWASGASVLHPEPPLQWFWERFQFSHEMREREGLPEITEQIKRNILGLNYLRMHGLDAEALAQNIEGDEFAVERSKGKPKPYATTYAKGLAR